MISPRQNDYNQEPTAPLDDDSFVAASYHAADVLDSPLVNPDTEGFEVFRIPFGRLGNNGILAADLAWSSGLSSRIIYTPYDTGDKGRIHVKKGQIDPYWKWVNYEGRVRNNELMERLIDEWPIGKESPTNLLDVNERSLYKGIRNSFLRLSPSHWHNERSYRFDGMSIMGADELRHTNATVLAVRTDGDGLRRIQLTSTQPIDSGDNTPVRCRATIDRLGTVDLHAYKHSLYDDRVAEVPIIHRAQTLGSLSLLLDRLVDEKYPLA